jgi:hypothetical protein
MGRSESKYESKCRDAKFRVSTGVLAERKIIFIHEISNAKNGYLYQFEKRMRQMVNLSIGSILGE